MKKKYSCWKNLLNDIKGSLNLNKQYLKTIIHKKFSYSILYFLKFIYLLGIVSFIFFIFVNKSVNKPKEINSLFNNLNSLPKGLVITIKNNLLSTNQNMPIFLWTSKDKNGQLFAVIYETANWQKIKEYDSLILLTSKNIVFKNKPITKSLVIPYNSKYSQITKKDLINFVNVVKKIFPYIIFFSIFILIFFAPIGIFIGYLIYIFFISLIVHFAFKLFSTKQTYIKTFQISVHSSTLPIILNGFFLNSKTLISNQLAEKLFFILLCLSISFSVYQIFVLKEK